MTALCVCVRLRECTHAPTKWADDLDFPSLDTHPQDGQRETAVGPDAPRHPEAQDTCDKSSHVIRSHFHHLK